MSLWSSIPRDRLNSARQISESERKRVIGEISNTSPMEPWPFGMPTSVNPFVLTIGPSPGNSPNRTDTVLNKPAASLTKKSTTKTQRDSGTKQDTYTNQLFENTVVI